MATKKPRKRAYIPPSHEVVHKQHRAAGSTSRSARTAPRARAAGAYEYPVPSLSRTLRRLPVYFVLIFALQFYLLGTGAKVMSMADRAAFAALQAGLVTLMFAPFMHVMDRFAYNRYLKRSGGAPATQR